MENKFTQEEIESAKEIKAEIIAGNIPSLKSVYMAGEICMYEELKPELAALKNENDELRASNEHWEKAHKWEEERRLAGVEEIKRLREASISLLASINPHRNMVLDWRNTVDYIGSKTMPEDKPIIELIKVLREYKALNPTNTEKQ